MHADGDVGTGGQAGDFALAEHDIFSGRQDVTAFWHRLGGIDQQVMNDLFDARLIDPGQPQIGCDFEVVAAVRAGECEVGAFAQQVAWIGQSCDWGATAGEFHQLVGQLLGLAGAA